MAEEIVTATNFLKDYGTLIAIPAAAVVGSIVYWYQKYVDRKNSLIEIRRLAYRNYLGYLPRLSTGSKESTENYNSMVAELAVVGSDEVVFAVAEFSQYMKSTKGAERRPETYKKLIAKIVIRMRRDCFKKTSFDIETISNILPFE